MTRRPALRLALGLGALAGTSSGGAAALHGERRALLGFGTTLSLQAGHEHAATARRALDAAVAAL
ncbi:hypothetical protein ABTK99_19135, partial [Acinetobacter baumannii]